MLGLAEVGLAGGTPGPGACGRGGGGQDHRHLARARAAAGPSWAQAGLSLRAAQPGPRPSGPDPRGDLGGTRGGHDLYRSVRPATQRRIYTLVGGLDRPGRCRLLAQCQLRQDFRRFHLRGDARGATDRGKLLPRFGKPAARLSPYPERPTLPTRISRPGDADRAVPPASSGSSLSRKRARSDCEYSFTQAAHCTPSS